MHVDVSRVLCTGSLLCLLIANHAVAQGPVQDGSRKLTVSQSATVLVQPDAAVLTFSAITTETNAKNARESVTKRVRDIKEGIAALAFKNVSIEVVPIPTATLVAGEPNPDGSPRIQGNQARTLFQVTIREGEKEKLREMVSKLSDVVVENGGTGSDEETRKLRIPARLGLGGGAPETVPGPKVAWLCENRGEPLQKAIKKAMDEAMASARTVAGQANLRLMEIHISEPSSLRGIRTPWDRDGSDLVLVPVEVNLQITYAY